MGVSGCPPVAHIETGTGGKGRVCVCVGVGWGGGVEWALESGGQERKFGSKRSGKEKQIDFKKRVIL